MSAEEIENSSISVSDYLVPLIGLILSLVIARWFYFLVGGIWQMRSLMKGSLLYKRVGRVRLWFSPDCPVPLSFFDGRAHVFLPEALLLERKSLILSLAHELQHHRQRDTVWVYFLEFLRCLFGFNPFVVRLIRKVRELQELACDEALIGHRRVCPRQYGKCLLRFAELNQASLSLPYGTVGMAVEAKQLKRRIEVMLQQRKTTKQRRAVFALALSSLVMAVSAWASQGVVSRGTISMEKARELAEKASRGTDGPQIPVPVSPSVLRWLNYMVGDAKGRAESLATLRRMEESKFDEMINAKLTRAQLPLALLAVPFVESRFDNSYISPMGAAGIWSFMPKTAEAMARACQIPVQDGEDYRRDPVRNTDSAVCYYETLHTIFQDWHVTLLAYAIGEQGMLRVINKVRHNKVLKLSDEGYFKAQWVNQYLPRLFATMIVLANPELLD